MKKLKKWNKKMLVSSALFVSLPFVLLSCSISKNNDVKNINKELSETLDQSNDKDEKKLSKNKEWEAFLKYEYIDLLLRLNYDDEKKRTNYIEEQKNLDSSYLKEIKEALYYTNAVALSHNVTENVVYDNFSTKLDELFSKNWLWFLFNLDRFTFINYEVFNGFKGEFDHLNEDVEKSALKLGAFNRPKTNQIYSYVIWNSKVLNKNNEWEREVYFITKEGIILKADLVKNNNDKKVKTTIFRYSHIYSDLFNNERRIRDEFDLGRYVASIKKGLGILSEDGNKREGSAEKILFDEAYGGEPLRYTIIDIDTIE
ncbi:aromatic motif membrane protein [Metamycoplasma auris]|uniref:Aromatic cluster surface protein n=1 Tax=Metamycoplasma auris TaxID=51363 RepID=A0A2W7G4G0_9BACT|nr:aromatic motif membrane protein [Metamycoplasma auris]PZV99950.1 aromatic cluster surface protein [Metamycoplasma auris]